MMAFRQQLLTLRCQNCGQAESWSQAEVVAKLREAGFLRRDAEPSAELALELAQSAVADRKWSACPACGRRAYARGAATDDADNAAMWGDARRCENCHAVIPTERIEVFPDSRLCARCQNQVESGGGPSDHEHCPACGSIMQLKLVQARGTSYRQYCPSCRKTF